MRIPARLVALVAWLRETPVDNPVSRSLPIGAGREFLGGRWYVAEMRTAQFPYNVTNESGRFDLMWPAHWYQRILPNGARIRGERLLVFPMFPIDLYEWLVSKGLTGSAPYATGGACEPGEFRIGWQSYDNRLRWTATAVKDFEPFTYRLTGSPPFTVWTSER